MFIVNKFDVMHSIPDNYPLPAGARKATPAEIADWQKADAANKAKLLAQKQEARQRAAQMVVNVTAAETPPATPAATPLETPPKGKDKTKDDDKPAA